MSMHFDLMLNIFNISVWSIQRPFSKTQYAIGLIFTVVNDQKCIEAIIWLSGHTELAFSEIQSKLGSRRRYWVRSFVGSTNLNTFLTWFIHPFPLHASLAYFSLSLSPSLSLPFSQLSFSPSLSHTHYLLSLGMSVHPANFFSYLCE